MYPHPPQLASLSIDVSPFACTCVRAAGAAFVPVAASGGTNWVAPSRLWLSRGAAADLEPFGYELPVRLTGKMDLLKRLGAQEEPHARGLVGGSEWGWE